MTKFSVEALKDIAKIAGKEILKVYNDEERSSISDSKDDNSPLTLADKAAHEYIFAALTKAYPHFPIISEEGKAIPVEERTQWKYYWLVDPLDGTKEFIKRNGQFTVNIAFMHFDKPLWGIIHVPVTGVTYYGGKETGSFKLSGNEEPVRLSVNNKKDKLIAVKSKSHGNAADDELLKKYPVTDSIEVGSSLKFCMVAEGKADIYYRSGPTMEWDTAAGHAVVEGAGGLVYANENGDAFKYNKASLLNGSFIVFGFRN